MRRLNDVNEPAPAGRSAMAGNDQPSPAAVWSALAPLRLPAFRSLWTAVLASNLGTWMQVVGAQWFLVHEANAALLVALVQFVDTFPNVAFAFLGGILADTFDRRRLLIVFNLFLTAVGVLLAVLTVLGLMSPPLLLTFTFLLGTASVVSLPAYQSLVNDIVPRAQLASAAALASMSLNLGRAVGPAIAGLLIAQAGVSVVFALNAATFLFYALVVIAWRPRLPLRQGHPEPFVPALLAGARYVRHSLEVKQILLRTALFVVPYSALHALLPVAATQRLGLDARGYALLLTAFGIGAIGGGLLLPRVNARLSIHQVLAVGGIAQTVAMVVVVAIPNVWPLIPVLLLAGSASILVLSNISAALQLFLPAWVRGRGLAVYQMVLFGSVGAGSLAFGLIAHHVGVFAAMIVAAAAMATGTASIRIWAFPDVSGVNRTAWSWPEPRLAPELEPEEGGAVMVTLTYTVPPQSQQAFIAGMELIRRARLATGAVQWGLFRDMEAPQQFTEVFVVASWEEHLRQHRDRLTVAEKELEARVQAFSTTEPTPKHYLETSGRPL